MKDKILELAARELKIAAWLDFVTMVVAVAVTLLFFGVAAGSASSAVSADMSFTDLSDIIGGGGNQQITFKVVPTIIMALSLIVIAVINWCGIRMLNKNKARRTGLNDGLAKLLKDETLDQYNDGAVYKSYETRYSLFTVIMGSVAALSIIVPIIIFIEKLTEL